MLEKRPRIYAQEIAALKTRQERQDALDAVPSKFRQMVKIHVENIFRNRARVHDNAR